jgi:tetratricopeptide (TPR) repeat protein
MHFRSLFWAGLLFSTPLVSVVGQTTGVNVMDNAKRDFLAGKNDSALATIEAAQKRGLTSPKLTELRGYIFLEQGKFDQAIQAFEAAKQEDKTTYRHLHIGDAFARQNKWQEALDSYQEGLKETDILTTNERLRFAIFICYLGLKDEEHARQSLEAITFPTESAAYYYAQAAWAFAHGSKREGEDWLKRARDIFAGKSTGWFERHLYDFGWLKSKPAPISD